MLACPHAYVCVCVRARFLLHYNFRTYVVETLSLNNLKTSL